MAEKLGITQQSYAQMESNLASTSTERLYTILRLLNVELSFVPSDSLPEERNNTPAASPEVSKRPDIRDSHGRASGAKSAKSATKSAPRAIRQSDKTKW